MCVSKWMSPYCCTGLHLLLLLFPVVSSLWRNNSMCIIVISGILPPPLPPPGLPGMPPVGLMPTPPTIVSIKIDTKLQNCWDIVVFFWHANYISFILLNLKKILWQIPYPLNQCCLTFLFIPKPAIEWTTLSQGRGDFKKTLKCLHEEYQMSQPILQLSGVVFIWPWKIGKLLILIIFICSYLLLQTKYGLFSFMVI